MFRAKRVAQVVASTTALGFASFVGYKLYQESIVGIPNEFVMRQDANAMQVLMRECPTVWKPYRASPWLLNTHIHTIATAKLRILEDDFEFVPTVDTKAIPIVRYEIF